ncbi:hypothetical protein [Tabrizicola sp.]|uniref:hypothetical protein n=1 Tax=Tabrizicola sp. TaxID=2005166 RepID=UPI0035B3EC3F
MRKTLTVSFAFLALTAAGVSAGHLEGKAYANGAQNSGDVAYRAVEQGTLHPGHVGVFATGKNGEEKYNKPAADYHLDGTPYESGPGGYGAQQSAKE